MAITHVGAMRCCARGSGDKHGGGSRYHRCCPACHTPSSAARPPRHCDNGERKEEDSSRGSRREWEREAQAATPPQNSAVFTSVRAAPPSNASAQRASQPHITTIVGGRSVHPATPAAGAVFLPARCPVEFVVALPGGGNWKFPSANCQNVLQGKREKLERGKFEARMWSRDCVIAAPPRNCNTADSALRHPRVASWLNLSDCRVW